MYLTKSLIHSQIKKWVKRRNELKKNNRAFDDLKYLNLAMKNDKIKHLLRKISFDKASQKFGAGNTAKILMTPKGTRASFFDKHGKLNEDPKMTKYNSDQYKMDFGEFLAHYYLHSEKNLDAAFNQSLKEILEFLESLENFRIKILKDTSPETMIDLMKIIIRMTNASEFVNKVYLLQIMNLNYLEMSFTFSHFTWALFWELGLKGF